MNTEQLAKVIGALIDSPSVPQTTYSTEPLSHDLTRHLVGKYVIVRDRNEGINAGIIEAIDETGVVLNEARRLWHHKPKNSSQSWYEGVANTGLSDDSKVSATVLQKVIVGGNYSVTLCTGEARQSIEGAVPYAQR